MKKLKKLSIKFIKFSIFGIIVYGGWLAYQKWEAFKPVLAKLEEKHPEKYAQMWEEATSLHISETRKLYRELDKMTLADVIDLRYNNFLEKRNADKKFMEESYDQELQIRIKERTSKLEDNPSKIEELKNLNQNKPFKIRFEKWKEFKPWQKKLILRDKCIKFIKKELADRKIQKGGLKTSKASTLTSRVGKEPLEIENLCANLVSSSTSQEGVQDSILRLKESMSFFYFTQLLDETGVPRDTIFQFKEELNRITRDYNDY